MKGESVVTDVIEAPARRRLVIADDSREMRWFVRSAIGGEFREVVEAANGRELLWTLLRSRFSAKELDHRDLVITDLSMPAYDGLEVLDAWQDRAASVPTILITAFPSAAVHQRAKDLGVIVLAKPFSRAALRQALREAMGGTR
jgi:CheY-like chemotaxis protein